MGLQDRHGVIADGAHGQAARGRQPLHKVADKNRDIVAAFGQRRDAHRHHVQAVIQVFAEAARFGFLAQVARGRTDHPRIHLHPGLAADAREGLVDQYAQNLALGFQRHVGHFVQIQGTVMRQLEQAGLARSLRAFHAEQLGLEPVRLHRGAVDGDKGVAGAARPGMDQARGHLLARPGGAGDQHAAVGGGDLVDQHLELGNRGRVAHHLALVARFQFQFLHFALETRRFQRPLHHMQQPVGLERLFDEIVSALLDRGDGGFDGAVTGDHHHRQVRLLALDGFQNLDAVHLRALQPDVEHDKLRTAGPDGGQRGFGIARDAGGIALVLQDSRDQIANILFVIDDQDFRRDQRSVFAHLPFPFPKYRPFLSSGPSGFSVRRGKSA